MKSYIISEEQLDLIEDIKEFFTVNSDDIKELCNSEKSDIEYGFVLGQTYSHLRQCFKEVMILVDTIKSKQKCIEKSVLDPEKEAIEFSNKKLKVVRSMLSEDYLAGFKEGVEKYIIELNKNNE